MPTTRRTLDRQEARRIIAEGCFTPAAATSIGLELEFLTFPEGDRTARADLAAMQAGTVAPLPRRSRITFEPGGQVEISTKPQPTPRAVVAAATEDIDALTARLRRAGVELVAMGADAWRPPRRVLDTPRYRAMERHFDTAGPAGRRMMCNTAALQINVSAGLDQRRWFVANAVGPALIAAFANSPGAGWKSRRLATWLHIDAGRTAPVVAPDGDVRGAWADYALRAPAFVCADRADGCRPLGRVVPFEAWIERGDPAAGFPSIDDLELHLTTLFPPVRPRGWLEVRYLDALPAPWWEVATLVLTALLEDAVLDDALVGVAGTEDLWGAAARDGLDDERLAEAADRCFELAIAATGDAGVVEYAERYVARRVPAWA